MKEHRGHSRLRIDSEKMLLSLRTKKFGKKLVILDECQSTNLTARELANSGASEGLTVLAETQSKGRGRHGRTWLSPKGGIWMSLVLRPSKSFQPLSCIPLIGAVAVARAVNDVQEIAALVRWPNDVLLNDRKLAGTLSESRITGHRTEYVILGIGLNCNFPSSTFGEATSNAISLLDATGHIANREAIITKILSELEALYDYVSAARFPEVLEVLAQVDASSSRKLTVDLEGETISGVFEKYLSLTSVRILTDHNTPRQIETSSALYVEYEPA